MSDESTDKPEDGQQPENEYKERNLEDAPVEASAEDESSTDVTGAKYRLLDRLLYKGKIPRYAFPTDVATFHVFDDTSSSYNRVKFKYTPSQSVAVALSQYAPGREVVIDDKRYVSGAIYSRMREDLWRAWQHTRLYAECEVCGYAETYPDEEEGSGRGEYGTCPACNSQGRYGPFQLWMEPPGFAHPRDEEPETSSERFAARTYATRAKLSTPSLLEEEEWSPLTDRLRQHATRRYLLVTNRGPQQDGYNYCRNCGRIEPTALGEQIFSDHEKPFPAENQDCIDSQPISGLVLGTDFITDLLLISFQVNDPVRLEPGTLETRTALRTICEALTLSAADLLEIERNEVEAEFRPAMTEEVEHGLEAEIYMYDSLSGGAGFSRQVGELGKDLYETALDKLENCPENCDGSCYSCLRSFRNRLVHSQLDRFIGSSLLRYALDGELPALNQERLNRSRKRLVNDLRRQSEPSITVLENETVEVRNVGGVRAPVVLKSNGKTQMVTLHHALTPGYIEDDTLRKAGEVSTEIEVSTTNELIVQKNLPTVTGGLLETVR